MRCSKYCVIVADAFDHVRLGKAQLVHRRDERVAQIVLPPGVQRLSPTLGDALVQQRLVAAPVHAGAEHKFATSDSVFRRSSAKAASESGTKWRFLSLVRRSGKSISARCRRTSAHSRPPSATRLLPS